MTHHYSKSASCILATLLGLAATPLHADVKVPSIFGDHMVLQQDIPLPVWGLADPGEKVTVTAGTATGTATAGADGKWRVTLSPLASTATPFSVTITGKNTLTINDVLVGEVWFASGQSNMAFPLNRTKNAAADVPKANDPQYRFFHVNGKPGLQPSDEFKVGIWELVTPQSVQQVSGVAYYFGKALREKLQRPVGIVQSAVGGTVVQAWTPLEALKKDPALKDYADAYDKALAAFPAMNADYQARFDAWHQAMAQWNKDVGTAFAPVLAAWRTEAEKDQAAGQKAPPMPKPSPAAPVVPVVPWGGNNTPTVLFNGEVAPVVPYAIRGAIWYQGESNAKDWEKYHAALSALITSWREAWGEGNFPFLIAQLPRLNGGQNWPQIREAQAQTQALPNTKLAVTFDVGDPNNLHPVDKADVAARLALVARHAVYGEKDLVWGGPLYDSMKIEGNTIRLNFTNTGSGLVTGSSPWVPPGSQAIPTSSLLGFAVADADKHWFPADAKIDGNTVVVSSDKVAQPAAIRYGWQNSPVCNLYNKEGLPASPFRTDDWADESQTPPVDTPPPVQPPVVPAAGK